FDRLYREGAERAKIMAVAGHPYISGAPHRIRYFEEAFDYARRHPGVAFLTGGGILAWVSDGGGRAGAQPLQPLFRRRGRYALTYQGPYLIEAPVDRCSKPGRLIPRKQTLSCWIIWSARCHKTTWRGVEVSGGSSTPPSPQSGLPTLIPSSSGRT